MTPDSTVPDGIESSLTQVDRTEFVGDTTAAESSDRDDVADTGDRDGVADTGNVDGVADTGDRDGVADTDNVDGVSSATDDLAGATGADDVAAWLTDRKSHLVGPLYDPDLETGFDHEYTVDFSWEFDGLFFVPEVTAVELLPAVRGRADDE